MDKSDKKVIKFSMDMNKIEEMIDELMNSMMQRVPDEKQPFVMGFTINFNSDEIPLIEELKEIPDEVINESAVDINNFLAEAHYFDKEVLVSFELPKNLLKKDLSVNVTEKSVLVKASKHGFSKRILLKEKINPKEFFSNFNNCFFELTFKKK